MYVDFNEDKTKVIFKTQNLREINTLKKFSGINKRGLDFWIPNDLNVIQNVFNRLRGKIPGAQLSPELYERKHEVETLLELPLDFYFYTDPLLHQVLALRHLYTRGSLGLLLDPGLGKTKTLLDYIFLLKMCKPGFTKTLVIAPKALMFVWEHEAKKHRPELKVYVVQGVGYSEKIASREEKLLDALPPERRKDIEAEIRSLKRRMAADQEGIRTADVVVVNYAKAVGGGPFFTKFPWTLLAIDEGLVKDPYSQQTEAITTIARNSRYRVIMSGTLINNGPGDVFAPVRILEPALLGTSFSKFNDYYGIKIKAKDRSFVVGYRNREEIRSCLEAVSLVMRKEDWLELPPKTFHTISVHIGQAQREVYDTLAANYIAELPNGDMAEAENALSVALMLNQISNGFIYSYDDSQLEDVGLTTGIVGRRSGSPKKKRKISDRRTYVFKDQPKLNALQDLLQGPLRQERVVLWYNFSAEADLIESRLQDTGIKYLVVRGGCGNTGEVIDTFNEDSTYQVLLCQAKAVNYGVTILGTKLEDVEYEPELTTEVYTHIFYSLNYSLEVFLQQQDRSHRIGQTKPVHYYILQANTEIEQNVYEAILNKTEIREEFLVDITNRLRGLKT